MYLYIVSCHFFLIYNYQEQEQNRASEFPSESGRSMDSKGNIKMHKTDVNQNEYILESV